MIADSSRAAWFSTHVALVLGIAVTGPLAAQMPAAFAPTLSAFGALGVAPVIVTTGVTPPARATAAGTITRAPVVASAKAGAGAAPVQHAGLASSEWNAALLAANRFLRQQLRQPRVRAAFTSRARHVAGLYEAAGLSPSADVLFRVFKREQVMEIWARDGADAAFVLMASYPVCKISGRLGPKRREGDRQIPEGFYEIDLFNPRSSYHLSMRVNYPNAVDRARGTTAPLGGDIYIHGGCATVGCVPLTDQGIEDVYLIAARAHAAGQRRIPVHIFPTRLDDVGIRWLAETYGGDFIDFDFWQNLREGYLAFEQTRTLPGIEADGLRYAITPGAGVIVAGGGASRTPDSASVAVQD